MVLSGNVFFTRCLYPSCSHLAAKNARLATPVAPKQLRVTSLPLGTILATAGLVRALERQISRLCGRPELLVSRGVWPPDHWMRWGELSRRGSWGGECPTGGVRVRKGRSRRWSARGSDRRSAGDPPGIAVPGGVPATYPTGPGLLHVCGSCRGGPPCCHGVAVGACGVVGSPYWATVGLEPRAVAGSELGKGASAWPGQQLFPWVYWRVDGPEPFVGCLGPYDLPIIRPRRSRLAKG